MLSWVRHRKRRQRQGINLGLRAAHNTPRLAFEFAQRRDSSDTQPASLGPLRGTAVLN